MLLGVVLHCALTYTVTDFGEAWMLKDPNTSHIVYDFIAALIHTFRMPIFFLVAGFFAAMLYYQKKPIAMVKNRVSRIVLPFIVFVVLLWLPLAFAFSYTSLVFSGDASALATTLSYFSEPLLVIPQFTFHLWFLYYLILITLVTLILEFFLNKITSASGGISFIFTWVFNKPLLRVVIFSGLTAVIYVLIGTWLVATPVSFVPELGAFVYYYFFYSVGWLLFKSKQLLATLKNYDWLSFTLAMIIFCGYLSFYQSLNDASHIFINALLVWLFIFSITGLFLRYTKQYSALMRYLSDASYWVYLIHLPFAVFIPSLIVDWPLSATVKFFIVLLSTGIICFVSYHYLVRTTAIGQFLNGKRYSKY
jgi:fucose 4-O-acetylase-like acetyltransferase